MKKIITLCLVVFAMLASHAQTQNPITWTATYKPVSSTAGEIVISAVIEKNWHTYSQRATEDGPVPTSFVFEKSKQYEIVGKAEESDAHEIFDNAFGAKIFVFSNKAEFTQKIRVIGKPGFSIPFKVEYMCCNDKMCLPPKTVDLSVKVQ